MAATSHTQPDRMPAVFIGHGSPMNTFESNRFTTAWRDLAAQLPRPQAILVFSAHWYVPELAVTAMPAPRTIHDFTGFPRELFEFDYPAPGSPALAQTVADLLGPASVRLDGGAGTAEPAWGLDHGTWSVLAQMYPDADIPVVQVSLDMRRNAREHMAIGAALNDVRRDGVLVLGSGNVVHNLSVIDWSAHDSGYDWAERVDAQVRAVMTADPASLPSVMSGPDWERSAPTPEHFIPLLPLAGLASASGSSVDVVVQGSTLGSLSMTSYLVH